MVADKRLLVGFGRHPEHDHVVITFPGVGVRRIGSRIAELPDGTFVKCKRRGLKIAHAIGSSKGEGLMRLLDVSADPVAMLDAALQEAARAAGVELTVEDGSLYVTLADAANG